MPERVPAVLAAVTRGPGRDTQQQAGPRRQDDRAFPAVLVPQLPVAGCNMSDTACALYVSSVATLVPKCHLALLPTRVIDGLRGCGLLSLAPLQSESFTAVASWWLSDSQAL